MGLWGLGKGIGKTLIGVLTADGEMIVKGVKKTAINAVTTVAQTIACSVMEHAHEDDDI